MNCNLICSQGRVGDKTNNTIRGAKLTAEALEKHFNTEAKIVGIPSIAKNDNWQECLPEASNTLNELQKEISNALLSDNRVLFASNTCSASLATLPAVVAKHPDIMVLWVDAHGDFNTPDTSESGYLGGMVLGAVCGQWNSGYGAGLNPSQVALIGVHDIDGDERDLLINSGVHIIPPKGVSPEALQKVIGDTKVWIHIDWDVLEPGQIPADYKVNGGLLLPQLIQAFESIPSDQILGIELAEFSADEVDSEANKLAIANILSVVNALLNINKSEGEK